MPSLLDSGSMVSLMWHGHFNRYFRPAEGSVTDANHILNLANASRGGIPLSRYVKLDVEFLGLHVTRVGIPNHSEYK